MPFLQRGPNTILNPSASGPAIRCVWKSALPSMATTLMKPLLPLKHGLAGLPNSTKVISNGKDFLTKQKEAGITRRLSGFMLDGKGFPRHGYEVFDGGQKIGYVTSGTVSPMLNKGIGMAYLDKPYDKIDTKIEIDVRGRALTCHRY
jgi:aminomethyltransferase